MKGNILKVNGFGDGIGTTGAAIGDQGNLILLRIGQFLLRVAQGAGTAVKAKVPEKGLRPFRKINKIGQLWRKAIRPWYNVKICYRVFRKTRLR
ncbi:MAG: hypothetical protein R3B47_14225 [Bacteroidia bacterium]